MLQLPPSVRKRRYAGFLVTLCLVLGAAAGLVWYVWGWVTPRLAVLGGEPQRVLAPFEGRVAEVLVAPGATVKAGELVLRLDDSVLQAAVADARARFALVSQGPDSPAAVRAAEASFQSAIQEARQHESAARQELEHATTLHVQAQLALRALDSQRGRPAAGAQRNQAQLAEIEARTAMGQARAAFEAASRARVAADADFYGFRAEMARLARQGGADPQVRDAAYAWLRDAEARLAGANLRARVDGTVGAVPARAGEVVRQGQMLVEIGPSLAFRPVWAYLSATEALRVQQGQPCVVDIPEAGLRLDGVVEAVQRLMPVDAARLPEGITGSAGNTASGSDAGAVSQDAQDAAVAFIRLEAPASLNAQKAVLPANLPANVSIRIW